MKKTLALLLSFILVTLSLVACGNTPRIQKYDWELFSVTKGEEEIHITGTLTAGGGKLTFTDTKYEDTYKGTYSERDEFSPTSADYHITLDHVKGRALVTVGENIKGETVTNLTLFVGDYVLIFVPEEK